MYYSPIDCKNQMSRADVIVGPSIAARPNTVNARWISVYFLKTLLHLSSIFPSLLILSVTTKIDIIMVNLG